MSRAKYTPAKPTPGSRQRKGLGDKPPSRMPTRESKVTIKSEEDIPRIPYQPEPGYDTLTVRRFREYLEETQIEEYFHKLLRLLLDREELPYNPYCGYVVRMRQRDEKFHMDFEPTHKIKALLWNNLQESYLPNLYTVRGFDNVWGLSSILRVVNPQMLSKYKWLLNDLTPHPEDVLSIADYTNQVMVALVGPCVFEGTFYPQIHNVQIRKEYLVSGPDVKTGLSLFINAVMAEIDGMYSNPSHLILGVNIPVQDTDNPDIELFDFWSADRIQDEKQEFLQAMSDTVINNKYIYMECIFRIDPGYPKYMRGQIQFGLNFLEVVDDLKEEGLSSFCEFPMASLHEGVFLNRSHAESYISLFMPQFNPYEQDAMQPPIPHTAHSTKTQGSRRLSAAQNQDMRTVRHHIYDRFQHVHPTKIMIDGFKIGDDTSYGPFAWQITTPIKSYFQKRIAGYHVYAELFEAVYCMIILILLDRDAFDAELPVELYRLLHSTAGRFNGVMEQNKSLRFIVRGFSNTHEINAIRENLALYKESVKNLFLNNLYMTVYISSIKFILLFNYTCISFETLNVPYTNNKLLPAFFKSITFIYILCQKVFFLICIWVHAGRQDILYKYFMIYCHQSWVHEGRQDIVYKYFMIYCHQSWVHEGRRDIVYKYFMIYCHQSWVHRGRQDIVYKYFMIYCHQSWVHEGRRDIVYKYFMIYCHQSWVREGRRDIVYKYFMIYCHQSWVREGRQDIVYKYFMIYCHQSWVHEGRRDIVYKYFMIYCHQSWVHRGRQDIVYKYFMIYCHQSWVHEGRRDIVYKYFMIYYHQSWVCEGRRDIVYKYFMIYCHQSWVCEGRRDIVYKYFMIYCHQSWVHEGRRDIVYKYFMIYCHQSWVHEGRRDIVYKYFMIYFHQSWVHEGRRDIVYKYFMIYCHQSWVHEGRQDIVYKHERSTEQITAGRVMVSQVDDLLPSEEIPFASSPHIQMTLKTLKNLNWYSLTLMLQLSEDCLSRCQLVAGLIGTMKQTFPESVPQPVTRHRQKPDPEGAAIDSDVPHGVEDENIKTHDKSVLNVQTCIERETSPKAIAKEAVLLRYIVDTHLDKVWHDFLIDLAVADYFPPNPYPRLVSVLRQSAMRMDLCYTSKAAIDENMVNSSIRLEDPENFVFTLPGVEAHGTISAINLLDIGQFVPLSQFIQNFVQLNYIQRKGPYRVGLCLAISGPTILYGKMQPYLNEVELHEHCYIQGPPGCQGEAIQLFANIVHNHVQTLIKGNNSIPVVGVFFGDSQTRWSWEDIVYKKMGFIGEFATICARKEPIFMKIFYPENPVAFYQSIFLSRDRAAFHFQNGGPKNGGDPMSGPNIRHAQNFLDEMLKAAEYRCDMITLQRGLLLKSLLNQNTVHVAETWRMLHSQAAQYEYLINYAESLQDLIQLYIEYELYDERERAKNVQTAASQRSKPASQQSKPGTKGQPSKPGTKGKKQQQPQTAQSNITYKPELENPVDEALIGKMTMAFLRKLSDVCESRISLTSSVLQEFVLNKLKSALEEDFYTGNVYFAFDTQTMFRLEEVRQMLRLVQDGIAADVHMINSEACATMYNLGRETKSRRTSIMSTDLEDPYLLRKVPSAVMMQTIPEELLYLTLKSKFYIYKIFIFIK
ncbi:hypothetical protein KUTeg_009383 [Tegillarca granosa]|uniref:Uncharacterized protein n=1 Tax=Tegillarca granosa TaxID=220873 RepID=A0ABQ9F6V8_TEGGR|nr:hypothetical protein KUTeg_009383 [Tegillarca granosa]